MADGAWHCRKRPLCPTNNVHTPYDSSWAGQNGMVDSKGDMK
ncbi:MAG: hypothetical protein M5U34_11765 [Chloroflexi bacterium]|nr:hypothetical protein [Chloroflexota bacterium]